MKGLQSSGITQAAYVTALKYHVYHDKNVLLKDFVALLESQSYQIKCGFVGAPLLCQTFAEYGREDLAYRFLFKKDYPSWLYAVNMGATTVWERWNSVLPDGKISGTGMNNLNHYSYGSVVEFLYAYKAGITPLQSGFEIAKIAPKPHGKLKYCNCSYVSSAGRYVCKWKLCKDGSIDIQIEVPFGCRAQVLLPGDEEVKEVSAGKYHYHYIPKHNYLEKYSERSSLDARFFKALLNRDDKTAVHVP